MKSSECVIIGVMLFAMCTAVSSREYNGAERDAKSTDRIRVASILGQRAKEASAVLVGEEQMRNVMIPAFIVNEVQKNIKDGETVEGVAFYFMNGFIGELCQKVTKMHYYSPEVHRDKWMRIGGEVAASYCEREWRGDMGQYLKRFGFVYSESAGSCRLSGAALVFNPAESGEQWFLFLDRNHYDLIKMRILENNNEPINVNVKGYLGLDSIYMFPFSTENCSRVFVDVGE